MLNRIVLWLLWSGVALAQPDKNAEIVAKLNSVVGAGARPTPKQMMLSLGAGIGALFVMVALAWLLISIARALFKAEHSFIKPLVLLVVGAVMWMLPKIFG